MEIITSSKELDKKEIFQLTHSDHKGLKDVETGTQFDVRQYAHFVDDGKEIAVIYTEDGESFSTTSPTVIKTMEEAFECMETYDLTFELTRNVSKNGRTFMNVNLI